MSTSANSSHERFKLHSDVGFPEEGAQRGKASSVLDEREVIEREVMGSPRGNQIIAKFWELISDERDVDPTIISHGYSDLHRRAFGFFPIGSERGENSRHNVVGTRLGEEIEKKQSSRIKNMLKIVQQSRSGGQGKNKPQLEDWLLSIQPVALSTDKQMDRQMKNDPQSEYCLYEHMNRVEEMLVDRVASMEQTIDKLSRELEQAVNANEELQVKTQQSEIIAQGVAKRNWLAREQCREQVRVCMEEKKKLIDELRKLGKTPDPTPAHFAEDAEVIMMMAGLGPFVAPPQAQWAPTSLASPAHNMRRAEALEPKEWQAKAVRLLTSNVNPLVPAGGGAGQTQQQVACHDDASAAAAAEAAALQTYRTLIARARKLVHLVHTRVLEERIPRHSEIARPRTHTHTHTHTVGMSYSVAHHHNCGVLVVDHILVGGPAHRSKRIFAGDRILAVDNVTFDKQSTVASLQKALIGSDELGSTVVITVQHPPTALGVKRHAPSEADWTLGKVETVVLERVPATQVAHKSQMYECFMQMLDRAREVSDKLQQDALVSLAQEAEDLWQRTLLEMQEHDDACARLLQQLQSDAHRWLDEIEAGLQDAACLLLDFSGKDLEIQALRTSLGNLTKEADDEIHRMKRKIAVEALDTLNLEDEYFCLVSQLKELEAHAKRFVKDYQTTAKRLVANQTTPAASGGGGGVECATLKSLLDTTLPTLMELALVEVPRLRLHAEADAREIARLKTVIAEREAKLAARYWLLCQGQPGVVAERIANDLGLGKEQAKKTTREEEENVAAVKKMQEEEQARIAQLWSRAKDLAQSCV